MFVVFRDWDKEMCMEKEGWRGRFVGFIGVVGREGGKVVVRSLL